MIFEIDWECLNTDNQGRRSSDCNVDTNHRQIRYREYLGLSRMAFLSELQAKRLTKLENLRKRDNKLAKAAS